MSKKKAATKKRGRPKGAKTKERDVVRAEASRCNACGSADREPYRNATVHEYTGTRCDECPQVGTQGERCICGGVYRLPFSRVVLRRTSCSNCGQARIDKSWE